jgi:hypothetical protein
VISVGPAKAGRLANVAATVTAAIVLFIFHALL